jgi:transcriptional regulator of acetoin/glycerol metabolism
MSHPKKRATVATVLGETVKEKILAAYRQANWNTTHAASHLGICRRTLLRWVSRYRLRTLIDKERKACP